MIFKHKIQILSYSIIWSKNVSYTCDEILGAQGVHWRASIDQTLKIYLKMWLENWHRHLLRHSTDRDSAQTNSEILFPCPWLDHNQHYPTIHCKSCPWQGKLSFYCLNKICFMVISKTQLWLKPNHKETACLIILAETAPPCLGERSERRGKSSID